jgi:hypothetical protein
MTNVTWKILEGNWALPCFAQYGFETRAFIYNPLVYQSQKKIHHFPFRRWRIWGVSSQDWMPRSCWVVKDSRVRQTHPTEPGSGVGLPLKPMGTSGSENGGNRVLTPGYPSMATWNIRTVMTNHGIWGPYFQTTHMVNIWGTYGKEMEKLSRKLLLQTVSELHSREGIHSRPLAKRTARQCLQVLIFTDVHHKSWHQKGLVVSTHPNCEKSE